MLLTVISDPTTGLLYESPTIYNDASFAYRRLNNLEPFVPLTEKTRARRTPDGCTVGENVDYLTPDEYIQWSGAVCEIG
jgi:hypothetical protein